MRGVRLTSTPPIPCTAGPHVDDVRRSLNTAHEVALPVAWQSAGSTMKSPDCSSLYHESPPPTPTHGTTFAGMYARLPTDRPLGTRYALRFAVNGARRSVVVCSISRLSASTRVR